MTTQEMTAPAPALNTSYLISTESDRQSFPALQANNYQPRNLKEAIGVGLAENSFTMLSEPAQQAIAAMCTTEQVMFGEDEVLFFRLNQARIVVLGQPKLFVVDKESGEVSNLRKGMKLAGTKMVTIAKVFALLVDATGSFIMDGDRPQVFTLTLRSTKTLMLGGAKSKPGDGSLASLNAALCKHYNVRGWLTHLVSVELITDAQKFTSHNTKDSSLGIMFKLHGNAAPLPEQMQLQAFSVAQDEDLKAIMANPFDVPTTGSGMRSPAPIAQDEEFEDIDNNPL